VGRIGADIITILYDQAYMTSVAERLNLISKYAKI